jgi:hypothetical protein
LLDIEDSEIPIILAAAEQLLGEESEIRQELIRGLLSGEGEYQGISRGSPLPSQLATLHHTFNLSDQTRGLSIWLMPLRIRPLNQALLPLKSLDLRYQNHRKRNPVLLRLVLEVRLRRQDCTSCKQASSITPALRTVRNGWMFLRIRRRRLEFPMARGYPLTSLFRTRNNPR